MPRKRRGGKAKKDGGAEAVAPPSKKEKKAQVKTLLTAAFEGDVSKVTDVLERWKGLTLATQQRYLNDSKDLEGETALQLAKRGAMQAGTSKMHLDPSRQAGCDAVAKLLLCAVHQNIKTALDIQAWEQGDRGQRFREAAPYIKTAALPKANAVLSEHRNCRKNGWTQLHRASHRGDVDGLVSALLEGANPLLKDNKGRDPRTLALIEAHFEQDLDKHSKRFGGESTKEMSVQLPRIVDNDDEEEDDDDSDSSDDSDDGNLDGAESTTSEIGVGASADLNKMKLKRRQSSIATDAPSQASGFYLAHLLMASSWLSVDEVRAGPRGATTHAPTYPNAACSLRF
jgi:hypothetical protein